MRLGARKTLLEEGSLAMDIYNNELLDDENISQSKKNSIISERHRLGLFAFIQLHNYRITFHINMVVSLLWYT